MIAITRNLNIESINIYHRNRGVETIKTNKMKKPIFTLEQELSKLSVAALRCKREILRGIENSALGRLIKRFIDWMEKTLNK